uniref:Hyaluronidase n=1 Tax=Strigamia maritima TaxID=126957 RepID=T1JN23_STRMM
MFPREIFLWTFYLFLSRFETSLALIEPQHDFIVIWNVPTQKCSKLNFTFDLSKYNIIHNENGSFDGEKITIFYKIGKFPSISNSGEYINGGLPQLGQFSDHLDQVKEDVTDAIPDAEFNGFAVIDWESWRPTFQYNWGELNKYKEESRNLVKKGHLLSNTTFEIETRAEFEFEIAARLYMQYTINISQTLRPRGNWGYYGFPDCYNYEHLEKYCSNDIQHYNDKTSWLFNSSSVLYPSIYISKNNITENSVRIYGKLYEANRVGQKLAIYPYAIVHYQDGTDFLSAEDLLITIGQAGGLRFPGIVLWGSSSTLGSKEKCEEFSIYFNTILGPVLNKIRSVLKNKTESLQFPDSLDPELWAEKIIQFYQ